jgi:hypothetical protein
MTGLIDALKLHSRQLRGSGRWVFALTVLTLFLTLSSLIPIVAQFFQGYYSLSILVVLFTNFVAIFLHESHRKSGEAVFVELSDELQWHIRRDALKYSTTKPPAINARVAQQRPAVEVRVALQDYANSVDLPLTSGRHGSLIYTAINVVLVIVFLIVTQYLAAKRVNTDPWFA